MGKLTISMASFSSYVSLPEGKALLWFLRWIRVFLMSMIEQRFQDPRSYSFIQIADEEIRRLPKFIVNQVQVETWVQAKIG